MPPSPTERAAGAASPSVDRLLAVLLALPALVLAWPGPGALLEREFATTEVTATGAALLASLPAAVLLAARGAGAFRGLRLLLVVLVALALSAALGGASDTLERDRALAGLVTGVVLALGGASLARAGRRLLVRLAVVAAVVLLARALADFDTGCVGVLGNAGELSAAALPGAAAGAVLLCCSSAGGARAAGAVAALLFLVQAARAPVLTAPIALGAALVPLAAAALRGTERRGAGLLAGGLALAALVALLVAPRASVRPGVEQPAAASADAVDAGATTGGLAVRRLIWPRALALVADHPLLGVGAGQFAVAFPPYRDPREIELSSHHRADEGQETEVEHPHSDWLAPFTEGGLVAGLPWVAFLLLALAAGLRALVAADAPAERRALGGGVVALLVAALLNAPLTYNPTAAALAFPFLGALLALEGAAAPRSARARRLLPVAAGLALASFAPRGLAMVRHGRALARLAGEQQRSIAEVEGALADALDACPDSVAARSLEARVAEAAGRRAEARAAWEQVLALRPHRFAAWMQTGVLRAVAGETARAHDAFERAAALDPGHPGLRRNLARLDLESGRVDDGLARVRALREDGLVDELWCVQLASDLLLRGLAREAVPLLEATHERFVGLTGEQAYALSREYRLGGSERMAEAFEALAQLLWGRAHAADGRWDDARRSLYQYLRRTRHDVPGGPTRVRMELGAAMWRAGQQAEAREQLAGLEPTTADWAALPPWAGETLLELGVGAAE